MAELSLLALGGKDAQGQPFFAPHHLAAAERLERLVLRAQMTPALTMRYGPRVSSGNSLNVAGELSDGAADARQRLQELATSLPGDCWGVLLDVCCFGKGMGEVETERRWPRRSAKLVLRIGLEQLAERFGLAPHRAGSAGGGISSWLAEKPPLIRREPS